MVAIAGKELSTADAAIVGTGAVMVVDLFIPWYRVSIFGQSFTANAFDAGFLSWFSALLLIAVAGVTAARIFAGFEMPTNAKVGPTLMLAGASALALVLLLLRFLTENNATFVGLYIAIISAGVQVFFGYAKFKASGEAMPDFGSRGGHSGHGGTPPPPPPA